VILALLIVATACGSGTAGSQSGSVLPTTVLTSPAISNAFEDPASEWIVDAEVLLTGQTAVQLISNSGSRGGLCLDVRLTSPALSGTQLDGQELRLKSVANCKARESFVRVSPFPESLSTNVYGTGVNIVYGFNDFADLAVAIDDGEGGHLATAVVADSGWIAAWRGTSIGSVTVKIQNAGEMVRFCDFELGQAILRQILDCNRPALGTVIG